jgi:hypothetical protein
MIDKPFQSFVVENLSALDELTRRYGEYRSEVVRSYLDELGTAIERRTPAGYRAQRCSVLTYSEQMCGWVRELEISGTKTLSAIGFGFYYPAPAVAAGQWPFMNASCWTGVKVRLPKNLKDAALALVRELALDTEPSLDDWLLYRPWAPLSATSLDGFHTRIIGEDRATGQNEIVEQLFQWKADFDNIVAHLTSASG